MPVIYAIRERDVVAFLEAEAAMARMAQDAAAIDHPDKLYRMGQKDGLLFAAEAIRNGILQARVASGMSAQRAETAEQAQGQRPASPTGEAGDAQGEPS